MALNMYSGEGVSRRDPPKQGRELIEFPQKRPPRPAWLIDRLRLRPKEFSRRYRENMVGFLSLCLLAGTRMEGERGCFPLLVSG